MLTIGKEYFREQINPSADIRLLGQELNAQTYAICKSDMLITGENPDAIRHGSSLSNDQFQGEHFDYMITNPPFGVSWKSDEGAVKAGSTDRQRQILSGYAALLRRCVAIPATHALQDGGARKSGRNRL